MLLDGKTGEVVGKLGEGGKAHSGGIYSVSGSVWLVGVRSVVWRGLLPCMTISLPCHQLSWSPDSRQVLTASGDKSCKIFDVETCQVVT